MTSWNRGAEKVFGYTAAEMIGQPITCLIPPDRLDEEGGILSLIRHGASVGHFDTVRRHKNGHLLDVSIGVSAIKDAHGKVIGASKVARDITERKRAENALRLSEEHLRLATDAALMGTWERDLKTDKLYWSASMERLMGYEPGTFPGTFEAFYALVHPDSRTQFLDARNRATTDSGAYRAELRFKVCDGRERWGLVSGQVIYDESGKPDRIVGVDLDITERKQAEEKIRKLNDELEQRVLDRTAQLAAVNKELEAFSYSVSHDLRAPLRHINGFSQALLEDYADKLDEVGKSYLNEVRNASTEMARLIDDVLQLARVTRLEMHRDTVDLSELVSGILATLQKRNPERVVKTNVAECLKVSGDKRLLEIMLTNLLENAWKFTSKKVTANITFGQEAQDGKTVYFVRDDGAGFDMAYVGKLFRAFQRLHTVSEFEGTGIGLATVQRVILRHGGNVWCQGAVNEGATFYFTLSTTGEERYER